MIKKLSSLTIKLSLGLIGLLIAVLIIVAIRLNMAPISLMHFLPYVEKQLVFYKYAVQMNDLTMSYDGRLVISGQNVRLVDKESRENVLNLDQATFRFSNSNLLRAKFVPREIFASGLRVAAEVTEHEVRIGDRHAFLLGGGGNDVQINVPLVSMLEDIHKDVSLSGWQKFEIEDAQLQLKDARKGVSWAFSDVAIFLDSDFRSISSKLTGIVKRSGVTEQVPLSLNLSHNWGEKNLHVKAEFSEISGDVVRGYVPQHLTEMVQSRVSGQIETDWNDITLFDGLQVSLQAPETTVKIPRVFSDPLEFSSVSLDGEVSVNRFGRLSLSKLEAVDLDGTKFTASGEVSKFLSDEPQLDVELRVSDATLGKVQEYIPDTVSANATKWIDEHLNKEARVKNFLLTFKPAAPMPFCGADCGLDIQFDYDGLTVSDIRTLPPATGLAGHFTLGQNEIRVNSRYGTLANQKAEHIKVRLDELFSTGESFVYIETEARGPADEVVTEIKKLVADSKVPPLTGEHSSDVKIKVSTKKENVDDIRYEVSSTLAGLTLNLPEGNDVLKTPHAEFNGRNGYSHLKTDKATLGTMPVSLVWSLEKQGANDLQSLELQGTEKPGVLLKEIPETLLAVQGTVPFTLKMMQKNKAPQKVWIESQLDENEIDLKLFNWQKEAGEALKVKAEGTFEKGKRIALNKFSLKGADADVSGAVEMDLASPEGIPDFKASKFKLGEHNNLVEFSFDGKKLSLKGQSLDVQNLFIKNEEKQKSPLEDMADFSADVGVDNIFLAGGLPWDFVKGTVRKKGNKWDSIDINAQAEGSPATIKLMDNTMEPDNGFEKRVEVKSSEAGRFLRSLGVYEHMRGGHMEWNGYFNTELTKGKGNVRLDNVRIVKAPLLVKLISFLSLEELLSSQSGIKFEDVTGHYTYADEFVDIPEVRMSGPSIGLRAIASAHIKENAVSVRGQMIPAEGLNQVVSNIPLIGTILTGSQEGLSVANFSILGDASDPSVSVNPLSLLTPGLVKDFFSGLMGDGGGSVQGVKNDLKDYLKKKNKEG